MTRPQDTVSAQRDDQLSPAGCRRVAVWRCTGYIAAMLSRAKAATGVIVGTLLCVAVAPMAHAATAKPCGSISVKVTGSRYGGRVEALRVACPRARRVMRYALTHQHEFGIAGPAGWTCQYGGAPEFSRIAVGCTRRKDNARVRLLYP